jgi:hypothetical protein
VRASGRDYDVLTLGDQAVADWDEWLVQEGLRP